MKKIRSGDKILCKETLLDDDDYNLTYRKTIFIKYKLYKVLSVKKTGITMESEMGKIVIKPYELISIFEN